jgi:hypothetical protein
VARFNGGSNARDSLSWACLCCNTWPQERRPGATDYGGFQFGSQDSVGISNVRICENSIDFVGEAGPAERLTAESGHVSVGTARGRGKSVGTEYRFAWWSGEH